jgi:hypothetical protein
LIIYLEKIILLSCLALCRKKKVRRDSADSW